MPYSSLPIRVFLLLTALLLYSEVVAIPHSDYPHHSHGHAHNHVEAHRRHQHFLSQFANESSWSPAHVERRQNGKKLLRIMPLGASITQGLTSKPEEGYRHTLRNHLRYKGYPVNMVGSRSHGEFPDKQHEGHPGLEINDVRAFTKATVNRRKPNLVLINLGTNDCVRGDQNGGLSFVEGTYDRMKAVIDDIYAASEGVVVILSTLLVNRIPSANNYVNVANEGFRRLVKEYADQGKKIALAETNDGWITTAELNDDTHPTNQGYLMFASIWADVFRDVEEKNWIVDPIDLGEGGGETCDPSPDSFRGPVVTQVGSGYNDFNYRHSSVAEGAKIKYRGLQKSSLMKHFFFAQLVNSNGADLPSDDFVRILDPDQVNDGGNLQPRFSYQRNRGDGNFDAAYMPFNPNSECIARGVRFGDFNGDGLDDFVCINLEGQVRVAMNLGGSPPKFGPERLIRSVGFAQDRIRLGDIDGDGRVDICWFPLNTGNIHCARNTGIGDDISWQPMEGFDDGVVATFDQKNMETIDGVRLLDINGDARADWVYVHPDGSTRIFINHRGLKFDGPGLKPKWVEADSAHIGFQGETNFRDRVLFGRVWGTGRNDYIRQMDVADAPNQYDFFFHRNTGEGGTKLRGDGAYYCDMYGRGHDDYLWVFSGGEIQLFENVLEPPRWNVHGKIYDTGKNRKWIQFADWDGDGKCDILNVDRDTGNVFMYRNTWSQGKAIPTFDGPRQVVDGGLCPQKYSPGLYDLAVRFGDLDADGRADYLCLDADGRTRGWLNKAGGLESKGQVKVSENYDRANHRFADVNGDGAVDFIWVDKFSGRVRTWINKGFDPVPSVGSSMTWTPHETGDWIDGKSRGQNIHFPKLSNSGRADYHWVAPEKGDAQTYFNECAGESNGPGPDDDNGVPTTDPVLPLPGRGDDDGGGNGDTPWPLLYIGLDSTTVHLDLQTSALAHDILQANTCPVRPKRQTEALAQCIENTFNELASHAQFLTAIVALYMGSPIPGDFKSMTDLPRWSDESQQAAFIRAVIVGAAQLGRVMADLSDAEVVLMTYAVLNIAIKRIWDFPNNYNSFSIDRSGRMEASCPAREEIDCSHQLCNGGKDGVCDGFFSPCACTQGNSCPNKEDGVFYLICDTCGGADELTGECRGTSDGTHKGCPCVTDIPGDVYAWDDGQQWNDAIQQYLDVMSGPDFL